MARGENMGRLTSPCICSISSGLGGFSDIVRLVGGMGRRYDEGCTKGSS